MRGNGFLGDLMALVLGALVVVVAAAVVFALAAGGVAAVKSVEAKADLAKAEVRRADALVVEARTARDREGNLHREAMFQMWSLAVLALKSGPTPLGNVLSVLAGVVGGVVCGFFIVKAFLAWELWQEQRGIE